MRTFLKLQPVSENIGRTLHLKVPRNANGQTLLSYLNALTPKFEPSWIEEGRFTSQGRRMEAEDIVEAGTQLDFEQPAWVEPPIPSQLQVVYEDEAFIVVDKPSGVPVTPSGLYYQNSLTFLLRRCLENNALSPVHRLDFDTSGLLVLSANSSVRKSLQMQFQEHTVEKRYLALVFGRMARPENDLTTRLVQDRSGPIRSKWIPGLTEQQPHLGKIAPSLCVTTVLTAEAWRNFTCLVLQPKTGRTNQLRAQLAAYGHPIVGDRKYFPDPNVYLDWLKSKIEKPLTGDILPESDQTAEFSPPSFPDRQKVLLNYHALHACFLAFQHPMTGERLRLESSRPALQHWQERIDQSFQEYS